MAGHGLHLDDVEAHLVRHLQRYLLEALVHAATSTGLRYFGQKTTWHLQLQTTLSLLLHFMRVLYRLQIAIT